MLDRPATFPRPHLNLRRVDWLASQRDIVGSPMIYAQPAAPRRLRVVVDHNIPVAAGSAGPDHFSGPVAGPVELVGRPVDLQLDGAGRALGLDLPAPLQLAVSRPGHAQPGASVATLELEITPGAGRSRDGDPTGDRVVDVAEGARVAVVQIVCGRRAWADLRRGQQRDDVRLRKGFAPVDDLGAAVKAVEQLLDHRAQFLRACT